MGVVEVGVVMGSDVRPVVVLSRSHLKVFGVQLFPNRTLSMGTLAPWTRLVYEDTNAQAPGGSGFYTSLPSRYAHVIADGSQIVWGQLPGNYDAAWAKKLWHRYLCREKLWPRYCHAADVAHYMALPHHHVGKSLTRQEYEAMESAAKGGYTVDLEKLLETQKRAQEKHLARKAKRQAAKDEQIRRLRQVLTPSTVRRRGDSSSLIDALTLRSAGIERQGCGQHGSFAASHGVGYCMG